MAGVTKVKSCSSRTASRAAAHAHLNYNQNNISGTNMRNYMNRNNKPAMAGLRRLRSVTINNTVLDINNDNWRGRCITVPFASSSGSLFTRTMLQRSRRRNYNNNNTFMKNRTGSNNTGNNNMNSENMNNSILAATGAVNADDKKQNSETSAEFLTEQK